MNVLELYSGIGGMHFALEESGIAGSVLAAADINTVANSVYQHNFPSTKLLQRNIQSLSVKELDSMEIDMVLMSPPCQPFTRVGLQKDTADRRTDSFLHFLNILPLLKKRLKYILIENVKGFECSETRDELVLALKKADFVWQEFLICPSQLGVPNMRKRYYLIAVRLPLKLNFERQDSVMTSLPGNPTSPACPRLADFLENGNTEVESLLLSANVLLRWGRLLDIVSPESQRSCCFTKAYGRYVEGTGSVLCLRPAAQISAAFAPDIGRAEVAEVDDANTDSQRLAALVALRLRFFSPREVARLMCFPDSLGFPAAVTTKQRYRLLGNSINVKVVAALIRIVCAGRGEPG